MCTLANSEDPDEMLHYAAFHQNLYCSPRQKRSSEKELQFYLEIITCDSLIYTMDHSKFIISDQMKNPLVHKGLKNSRNFKEPPTICIDSLHFFFCFVKKPKNLDPFPILPTVKALMRLCRCPAST